MTGQKKLIQVGIKILRTPTGECMESMPIYMEATPELIERERALIESWEVVKAHYLKEYIDAMEKVKKQKRNTST